MGSAPVETHRARGRTRAHAKNAVMAGSARGQDHDHLTPLHLRHLLDLGQRIRFLTDAVEHLHAEMLVHHLTAAKTQRHLDLVSLFQETAHRLHLHVVIVLLDVGAKLDLLDVDRLLLLARFALLFLRFVFHLAVVEDLADRRIDVSRDLDKIQACVGCFADRIPYRDDAELIAILVDEANLCRLDILVDARSLAGRRRGKRSLGYRIVLVVTDESGGLSPTPASLYPPGIAASDSSL